jgi:hypothetical protein
MREAPEAMCGAGTMTGLVQRSVLLALVGTTMLAVYWGIGHADHQRHALMVSMPVGIPFLQALTLPFLALLLSAWILPLAIRDQRHFDACLLASICAYLLVAPWWLLAPTELPRPPLPAGW